MKSNRLGPAWETGIGVEDAGFVAALCVCVAQLVGLRFLLGRTFVPGHRFADDFRPCLGVGTCGGIVSHIPFTA